MYILRNLITGLHIKLFISEHENKENETEQNRVTMFKFLFFSGTPKLPCTCNVARTELGKSKWGKDVLFFN
jgi:hypothetical protein